MTCALCVEQMVLAALVQAIPGIVNVAVLISLFWVIFAILGVSLFGGKLYACTDAAIETKVRHRCRCSTCCADLSD